MNIFICSSKELRDIEINVGHDWLLVKVSLLECIYELLLLVRRLELLGWCPALITSDGSQFFRLDVESVVNSDVLIVIVIPFVRDSVLQVFKLQNFISWARDSMKLYWVAWLAGKIGGRQISFCCIIH